MKWFLATNEESLRLTDFFQLLKVAIHSGLKNTTLEPFLLYDGGECAELAWVRSRGVCILHYSLSIKGQLSNYVRPRFGDEMVRVRSGAYLKTEIPMAMTQLGLDDPYVFYTDTDVMFLRNPVVGGLGPRYLAAAASRIGGWTRFRIGARKHYNSGVMLMNRKNLAKQFDQFREFVLSNGHNVQRPGDPFMNKNLFMSDEVATNLYFGSKIDNLGRHLNWHPSMGVSEKAAIVHFNGIKWSQWDAFLSGRLRPDRQEKFERLVDRAPEAYDHYVKLARGYLRQAADKP